MEERFSRTCLLIGEEGLRKLRQSTICVVGCGAVGSYAIESLARAGVGHLILVDFDRVEPSNLNRQLFALSSTLGLQKVDVAKQRIGDIFADTIVNAKNLRVCESTCPSIFSPIPDFVIDAIDSLGDKVDLILYLQKHNIPFISSMGAGLRINSTCIRVTRMDETVVCPMASKMRFLLRQKGARLDFPCVCSNEKPRPSCGGRQIGSLSTITGIFGLTLGNEAIQFLLNSERKNVNP